MKILYIYPHPDDESFGPAHVMHKQAREGHEVYLLTLTRGGATRQRFKYNYSVEEMGEVRYKEMLAVEKVLNLTGMTVLDLPDSRLKEMDPRVIEEAVRNEILKIKPEVIVTYPVHGISGFHDHLVCHSVVKRVFLELKDKESYLKRLAFTTVTDEMARQYTFIKINYSSDDEIDCVVKTDDIDLSKTREALDCYVTYIDAISNTKIKEFLNPYSHFELFQESFSPKITDLFEKLPL